MCPCCLLIVLGIGCSVACDCCIVVDVELIRAWVATPECILYPNKSCPQLLKENLEDDWIGVEEDDGVVD